MAFSEFELKLHERTMERFIEKRRPAPAVRDELDLAYRIEGQSVVIYEVRTLMFRPGGEKVEQGVAKATYVKSREAWRIYWMRSDLRWHRYDPSLEVRLLDDVLEIVDRDEHGAFFG